MLRRGLQATRAISSQCPCERARLTFILLAAVFAASAVLPVQSEDLSEEASGTLVSPTSIADIDSAVERTQSKALDKSPWLSDYKRASDLIPSSLLPENQSVLLYTRAYRVPGTGLLPLKQGLIDIQAAVLDVHCPLFEYEGRGFLVTKSASTPHSFEDLLRLKDEDSAKLCETVCMVQYFPVPKKENLTDCSACIAQQAEVGYEQYDHLHAMLEVTINRNSLLPEVMRLRWFPTSDDPVFSESGIQRELPQLETHIIHNAQLAQYVTQWHPYRAASVQIQMFGPGVAPLTVGKQNLIIYVLRQLEKHFFEVNQFFRMTNCSHDEQRQEANISLAIVTHTGITVGFDVVVVSYLQQFQNGLLKEGLNVTRMTVTGPEVLPNETPADQIALQLGQPAIWIRYRPYLPQAGMTLLTVLITAAALYFGQSRMAGRSPSKLPTASAFDSPSQQSRLTNGNYADGYTRKLHVDLYTGPKTERANLEICKFPDGSPWLLGSGACGKVYKAVRDDVQDVAVKVLAATSPIESVQLQVLKKEICLMHVLSYDRNMVQFYGACLDPACPMLVLEYMEGGDLLSCIQYDCYPQKIGKFRWYKKGGQVALDVAKGLVFLHGQKVVHNDIKSKNILLTKDATVAKIADVGTSRILETTATTLSAPSLCTWPYAAPEQLMGGRNACTNKVDMFSFGVVLWEIATQETPRRGFLRKTQVPDECPQVIEDLITSCLSSIPEQRPTAKEACKIIQSTFHLPDPLDGGPEVSPQD